VIPIWVAQTVLPLYTNLAKLVWYLFCLTSDRNGGSTAAVSSHAVPGQDGGKVVAQPHITKEGEVDASACRDATGRDKRHP
jgi:hypothetical protein